jgi:hypothetical protein
MASAAPAAPAAFVTLTVAAVADSYVDAANPTANFGAANELRIAWGGDGATLRRSFLRFDLSAIPGGSTIESARLTIHTAGTGSGGDVPLTIGRAAGNWTENAITWNNQPPASGPYALASAGDAAGAYQWDVSLLVSGWVSGSYANEGIRLTGAEGQLYARSLASREASAARLVVVYHAGPKVPPPPATVYTASAWYPPGPSVVTFTLPSLDLTITGIELTQAIQCYQSADPTCADNSVPMVLNKAGLVRVYVRANSGTLPPGGLPNVPVRININAGGSLYVVTSSVSVQSNPQRANLNDSANTTFRLGGTSDMPVQVSATINPGGVIPELLTTKNTYTLPTTTFWIVPQLRIVPVGVAGFIGGGLYWPPVLPDQRTFSFLRDTYPVPSINVRPGLSGLVFQNQLITGEADWGSMLAGIQALKDNDPTSWSASHWYGLVDPLFPSTSNIGGYAYTPSPNDLTTRYWTAAGLNGNWSVASQEIAHNLSRNHAPECTSNGVDSSWPLPNDDVGDIGWDQGGYDGRTSMSLVPATQNDFMGYCGGIWVSGYTEKGIFNRRLAILGSSAPPAAPVADQDYLIISGGIISGSAVQPLPFQKISHPTGYSDDSGTGPYTLELQNAGGAPLFVRNFDAHHPGCSGYCQHNYEFFHETVPYTNPAIAKIVFRHGVDPLGTVHVSPHAPTVTVTSPNGGEAWGLNTAHTISWSASDQDGDHLSYHILFSHDGGATWSPLASYITTTQLTIHATQFPGTSHARIRVIALDGVNSASDESDADFSIEPKPPVVSIHSPSPDLIWPLRVPLVLRGTAHDLQDGDLKGGALVWTSDRDGVIGVGDELIWPSPSPGAHLVTLAAVNSGGDTGSATIGIYVGTRLYLPLVTR